VGEVHPFYIKYKRRKKSMKKRILSIVLSVALIAGTIMAAFPGAIASAAEGEFVYHTWSVADDLLTALEEANGDASALEYGAIAYSGNYYGSTGVKTINYALDTYSCIATTGTNSLWQCQIQIPNNQGVGEGKNNQGVYVYVASNNNTQKLTFTAPVHGIYNFVPTAIGGANAIEESIAVNNGSLTVGVNVKGESIGEMTLAKGEKANLPEAKGVELEEGETIEVTFTAPTPNWDSNAGNNCIVNFKVDIVDEIAPQVLITELETKSFNLVDVYSLTNTASAVQPQKEGIFDYGYVSATGQSGSTLSTTAKSALYKEANGYSWYYGLFDGDSAYGVKIYKDTNKITFESKATAMEGFVITADKKGTYTLTSGAITKGGSGSMNLVVEDNAGNKLYSNGGNNADGLNITVEMDAGEKLYVFADRTNSDYNTSTIAVTDLALDVTYIPTRYVEPVYNVNEYVVADELRNNNASWPTAYQNPANFTYGGFLTSVAVTSGAVTDAFCRIYDSADPAYDKFSNEAQGYDNNTMEAYADGSMRWIYDYGDYGMGFKFTAPADAEYVLASDVFTGTGINAYVYSVADDGTLTQVGETVAVSATEGLNIAFTATKDTTYAVVVGKSAGGWGNQRNCKTSFMKLAEKVIVAPATEEEIVLEYIDDPEYVYVYETEMAKCIHVFGEGEITVAPTCDTDGEKTLRCLNGCGFAITETISAIGHDYDDGVITVAPSCESDGVKTYTCLNDCSHTFTEEIDLLGHNWGDWTETKAPGCDVNGEETRVCLTDGTHTETRETPVRHSYDNDADWACDICGAFKSGISYEFVEGEVIITGVDQSFTGDVVIPAEIDGCPVTKIGDKAFFGCSKITSVTIPEGVTSIGEYAFSDCYALKSVVLPNGLLTIGGWAFQVTSLTTVEIPESVTGIGDGAFFASGLEGSINIPGGIKSVPSLAFAMCYITGVDIADGVESIGAEAFANSSLTSIHIPVTVTKIYENAFDNCSTLVNVYYDGSESDRENLFIYDGNYYFTNAKWHYAEEGLCEHSIEGVQWTVAIPETCETNGSKVKYCAKCNEIVAVEAILATGHSYNEGVITVDPTCEIEGVMTYTCFNDDSHTYTEKIDALGHEYDNDDDTTCNACGEERAPDTRPSFTVNAEGAIRGETVTVYLKVKNVKANALSIRVAFDTDVLWAEDGAIAQSIGTMCELNSASNANSRGLYSYDMFSLNDETFADGELLELRFRVKDDAAYGNTSITISEVTLGTDEGEITAENLKIESKEICIHNITDGDWIVTAEPTWKTSGSWYTVCTGCGYVHTEEITPRTVESVVVTVNPKKLYYEVNISGVETFDWAGLVLTVNYSDWDTPTVIDNFDDFVFPEVNVSKIRSKMTYTFTFAGKRVSVILNIDGLVGDIDGNKKVNVIDVQRLFVAINVGRVDEIPMAIGDYDGNGKMNILDVQKLFVAVNNGIVG
jgi:hypothetical protein